MAKRRKETTEDEEIDFKIPKFDEESFLRRERRNIKTTFIAFLFGILLAVVSFFFWALLSGESLRWLLILLVGVFNAAWIKYIFLRLNIDLADFGKKGWFSTYGIYFLTWLIVLMVLCNTPFYDDEKPKVSLVVLPDMQEFGNSVKIVAKITDNFGVQKSDITLSINGETISPDSYEFTDNIFRYTYENDSIKNETTLSFTLSAKDSSNHKTERQGTFTFSNNTIFVPEPLHVDVSPGPEVGSATSIKFKVNADITRLYYTIDNGTSIDVTEKEGDFYVTYPKYEGWPKNKNVTLRVFAEKNYTFDIVTDTNPSQMSKDNLQKLQTKVEANTFSNIIVDNQPYYFQVAGESGVGTEAPPIAVPPTIKYVSVPGFEAVIFIISLIAVVLIFKRKNKDKKT